MYKSISKEIKGCDDNELDIKRQSPLSINLSYDDEKPMKALFVFIAGTGDDNKDGYQEHLAEFVVREYGVAFLRVEYFCLNERPQMGASYYMNDKDKEIFLQMCSRVGGIKLPENLFDENDLPQNKTYGLFSWVDMTLGQLKDCNLLLPHFKLFLSLSIAPTKNEYLNFGIMQANDIANAILYTTNSAMGGGA